MTTAILIAILCVVGAAATMLMYEMANKDKVNRKDNE